MTVWVIGFGCFVAPCAQLLAGGYTKASLNTQLILNHRGALRDTMKLVPYGSKGSKSRSSHKSKPQFPKPIFQTCRGGVLHEAASHCQCNGDFNGRQIAKDRAEQMLRALSAATGAQFLAVKRCDPLNPLVHRLGCRISDPHLE
eukprot:6201132-Amphidinium_carterae.1